MKIKQYSIETIEPGKRPAIWVQFKDRNAISPVAYLQKPKWLTEKQWEKVLKSITLNADENLLE